MFGCPAFGKRARTCDAINVEAQRLQVRHAADTEGHTALSLQASRNPHRAPTASEPPAETSVVRARCRVRRHGRRLSLPVTEGRQESWPDFPCHQVTRDLQPKRLHSVVRFTELVGQTKSGLPNVVLQLRRRLQSAFGTSRRYRRLRQLQGHVRPSGRHLVSRSYSACEPIQNQTMSSPVFTPSAR